jgi:small subunit ribosomal protein S16
MVRLRMQRFGRRHRPFYRINAIDQRTRRNGKVLENLGHYDPMHPDESKQIVLKTESIKKWLAEGAAPSETVLDILARNGLLSPEQMKSWEADRAVARTRVACKKAVARAEAAVTEMEKAKAAPEFLKPAKKALTMAKLAVPGADQAAAEKAAGEAEAKLAAYKAASEKPAEAKPAE